MTDLPNSDADPAANATSTDGATPVDDPELAALVQRMADPLTVEEPEPGVETVPVHVVAAAAAGEDGAQKPRRGRSLKFKFAASFVSGVLLAVGVGAAGLYAWGKQYDGKVLPGVSIGNTYLGGMTRDEAAAAIATAFGS